MMLLTMAKIGQVNFIKKIGGKDQTKHFLENLGFNEGSSVTVISELNGNVIVSVKNCRVAISKEMANKIMI